MSLGSDKYVRQVDGLTPAQRLVLRELSRRYSDARGCSQQSVTDIAEGTKYTERHVRRVLGELERAGLIASWASRRVRDNSQSSTEYEIVGYTAVMSDEAREKAMRKYPMRVKSERTARIERKEPKPPQRGRREGKRKDAGVDGGRPAAEVHGGGSAEGVAVDGGRAMPVEISTFAVEKVVDCASACPPGEDTRCPRGEDTRCPPIERSRKGFRTYYSRARSGVGVENTQSWEKPRATASAKATATTSSTEAARALMEGAAKSEREFARAAAAEGAAGMVAARADEVLRAAVRAEAARVLEACGWQPGALLAVVVQALEAESTRSGRAMAELAGVAIDHWRGLQAEAAILRYTPAPKRFFAEGLWLSPARWPYDERKVREARQVARASVGMLRAVWA